MRRGSRKFQEGWPLARKLASYIDTIYFTENSLTVIGSFTEKLSVKGGLGPPLNPPIGHNVSHLD